MAERLRTRVANMLVERDDGRLVDPAEALAELSIGVGVAAASTPEWSAQRLSYEADEALYQAKRSGRDMVCVAREEERHQTV